MLFSMSTTKPEWWASSTCLWSLMKLVLTIGKKCFDIILFAQKRPLMIFIWFGYVLLLLDTGFRI